MRLRKMIYKVIALMLALVFCLSAISCRRENENENENENTENDGDFTVSFSYGYNDKVLTEKVAGGEYVAKPDEPLRVGYKFDGWWISDGGEERLWDFEKDTVLSDITLKAKWSSVASKKNVITLNANGGVCEVDKIEVLPGEEYSLPIPTREGYYFFGWKWDWRWIKNEGAWDYNRDATMSAQWLTYPPEMTVKMGRFEQDNDLTNGPEEIEWDVIKYEDGKYFVISKYVLTVMAFNENSKSTKWADSTLRRWMNGEFLETSFSEEERKYIQDTYIKSVFTTDKIFCISYNDLVREIQDMRIRFGKPTPYSLDKGIKPCSPVEMVYWEDETRLSYDFYLISGKSGSTSGSGTSGKAEGVRPAMWISEEYLESLK